MFRTALLALDLSPAEGPLLGCMPALRSWGIERVVVAHVIRVGYAQGPQWREDERAVDRIEAGAAPLRAAGLAVEVQVRAAGVPADAILAAAAEAGADLVVIGSRSHDVAQRLILGSVAREVVRKARLPLLLEWVRPSNRDTSSSAEAIR
ncbi:MAG: universal stress protein [Gammaproteobacteria bacterium]